MKKFDTEQYSILSVAMLSAIYAECRLFHCFVECSYAVCVMLSEVILSALVLSSVMMSAFMLSEVMLSVFMLSEVMLSVFMLRAAMLSAA
jgi:hypothetical protein